MVSRSLSVFLLWTACVTGVKVPPRLRRNNHEDGLATTNVVEEEAASVENRLLNEDGLIEPADCVMLADVDQMVKDDALGLGDEECLNTMSCGGGCCRVYNYMTCDEDNSLMHLQCVCNANTRATGIYEGNTITSDGQTVAYTSDVVVSSAFAAGTSGGDGGDRKGGKGKGGKGGGKGKGGKDSVSGGSSNGVVSNAMAPPTNPPYVPPPEANGATITGISVTRPNNSGSAPAPAPGISNTVISSAVGAPGSTTTTVTGSNGATATVTVTNNAPGSAPGPGTGSSPGPGRDPVEQVQGEDGDIASQMAAIIDTVQGSQPVDATVTVNGEAPGPASEPVVSSAMGNPDGADGDIGAAMAEIIGTVQGAPAPAPDKPVVSSAMGDPIDGTTVTLATNDGDGSSTTAGTDTDTATSGATEGHVPVNACDSGSYLSGMEGYKACTGTDGQCNQAAGECCLAVYCVCGRPNGGIEGRCVPPYDLDLLLFT